MYNIYIYTDVCIYICIYLYLDLDKDADIYIYNLYYRSKQIVNFPFIHGKLSSPRRPDSTLWETRYQALKDLDQAWRCLSGTKLKWM